MSPFVPLGRYFHIAIAARSVALNSKVMRLSGALLFCAFLVSPPAATAGAQRGGILGKVSDTLGTMLDNVQVQLVDTKYTATSNIKGEFRLTQLKPGRYTLSMRLVGFAPFFVPIEVNDGDPTELAFELTRTEVRLAPVDVESERLSPKLRRVGFDRRRRTSGVPASHFLTHIEIEKRNPGTLSNLLERMRGRSSGCTDPNIFMDGMPAFVSDNLTGPGLITPRSSAAGSRSPANQTFSKNRTLDNIPVKDVDGLEVYASLSQIPAEFKMAPDGQSNTRCVVLVWTRER